MKNLILGFILGCFYISFSLFPMHNQQKQLIKTYQNTINNQKAETLILKTRLEHEQGK